MKFDIFKYPGKRFKIAIFDMDNTLLRRSFIYAAAEKYDFKKELLEIVATQTNPFTRTKLIARLLKGTKISELVKVAEQIPVTPHAQEVIDLLKENGFIVALMSDSYNCITQHFKNKFAFDLSLANELEFSNGFATGGVKVLPFFLLHKRSICNHEYCKTHALIHICKKFNAPVSGTLVIGDGENDICIIKKTGIGISFCSTNDLLDTVADFVIKEPDFNLLIPIIH